MTGVQDDIVFHKKEGQSMTKVLVTEAYLADIADAIRQKTGSMSTLRPGDMAAAIAGIDTGTRSLRVH